MGTVVKGQPSAVPPQTPSVTDIEPVVRAKATELFSLIAQHKSSPLSSEHWQSEMMDWAMADERLKVELFRFVDVFPTLRTRDEIDRHLREYFEQPGLETPRLMRIGLAADRAAADRAAGDVGDPPSDARLRRSASSSGATPPRRCPSSGHCDGAASGFTLDVLGEASVGDAEAEDYQQRYLELLDGLQREAAAWRARRPDRPGRLGPAAAGQRLASRSRSLFSQIDPLNFRGSAEAVKDALRPIFRKAQRDRRVRQPRPRAVPLPRPHVHRLQGAPRGRRVRRATTRPASSCRPTCATPKTTSAASSTGRANANASSPCGSSRAPTGTTRRCSAAAGGLAGARLHPQARHGRRATSASSTRHARAPRRNPPRLREPQRALARRTPSPPAEALGLPTDAYELQMLHGMAEPIKAAVRRLGLRAARVRARRRDDPRHGLPRAPAAREHGQRVVPASDLRREAKTVTGSSGPQPSPDVRTLAQRVPRRGPTDVHLPRGRSSTAARRLLRAVERDGDRRPRSSACAGTLAGLGARPC